MHHPGIPDHAPRLKSIFPPSIPFVSPLLNTQRELEEVSGVRSINIFNLIFGKQLELQRVIEETDEVKIIP